MIFLGANTTNSFAPLARKLPCVLFVQARLPGAAPLIRIEGTRDPVGRLRALSDDNAAETFLVGLMPTETPDSTEATLKDTFKSAVVRGSWYQSTNELLTYVQQHGQQAISDLLAQLKPHSHPSGAATIEELAGHLNVSVSTVRRMVKAGTIPYLRTGRQLRFIPDDIVASLQAGDKT